jgi:ketosteroid isomerase-like protein
VTVVSHAALLERFSDAWARRDIQQVAACLHPEAVYAASLGPEPGETFVGLVAVLKGIEAMWLADNAASSTTLSREIAASSAVVRWRYDLAGETAACVLGVDLFEFRDGLISLKDAYRKVLVTSSGGAHIEAEKGL